MRGKQAGAPVTLRMREWDGAIPEPGDYLVTDAGSGYEVVRSRQSPSTGRGPVDCVKVEPADIPIDARIHEIYWTPRSPRR